MTDLPRELPNIVGFRTGARGTHTSRTIMLSELSALLAATDKHASNEDYWRIVVEDNVLGKKTAATRKLSAQRLSELYALDPDVIMFRVMRDLWAIDHEGRPLLASLCANARDPLLRMTAPFVLETPLGQPVEKEAIVSLLAEQTANRFKDSTRDKIARNAASSWTQSGHLSGRSRKIRTKPAATPATTAYALLLGFLAGGRGEALLDTFWTAVLDLPRGEVDALAFQASRRGWLNYKHFGGVVSVDFSDMLTEEELEVVHGEGR